MKVAIYVRVSTGDQSTDMQLRDLQEYITNRPGLTLYRVYEDAGFSGVKNSRPALNEMMDDARKRKFQAVLVWKFDRFARSIKHLVTALDEFNELNVDFISYKENLDTSSSMGRAMFGMIGIMAQLERDIIQERVIAGLKTARAKGRRLGRPKTAPVESILKLKQQGMSIHKIATQLGIGVGTVHRTLKGA